MMKRLLIPLILFVLVVFEGVAIDLLPDSFIASQFIIVPHWVLIYLILVSLFYDTADSFYAVIYGIAFGLLIDIVYTGVLGVYMITYAIGIYAIMLMKRVLQANWYMTIIMSIIAIVIVEFTLGFIYSVVNIAEPLSFGFIKYRLLPTILANIIILGLLYPLSSKRLESWGRNQLENS